VHKKQHSTIAAMDKFKINREKINIPEGAIERNKNFKKLKANYDDAVKPLYKKPLYKDKKAFLVILIILLLAYIISEVTDAESTEKNKNNGQDSVTSNTTINK
jgi:hypothetical protein